VGVSYYEKINMDVDASPTKGFLIDGKDDPDMAIHWKLSFGKRPADELYDLRLDPVQLHNVDESGEHEVTLKRSKEKLFSELERYEDPRISGGGDAFKSCKYEGRLVRQP